MTNLEATKEKSLQMKNDWTHWDIDHNGSQIYEAKQFEPCSTILLAGHNGFFGKNVQLPGAVGAETGAETFLQELRQNIKRLDMASQNGVTHTLHFPVRSK